MGDLLLKPKELVSLPFPFSHLQLSRNISISSVLWILISPLNDGIDIRINKKSIILNKCEVKEHVRPVSTIVGTSPAVRVFDSKKVIFPGMSISKRCIWSGTSKLEITQQRKFFLSYMSRHKISSWLWKLIPERSVQSELSLVLIKSILRCPVVAYTAVINFISTKK